MNKIYKYFIIILFTSVVILPQQVSAASRTIFEDKFDDGDFSDWTLSRNLQWDQPSQPCKYGSENAKWELVNDRIGIKINGPACITDLVPATFKIPNNINYRYSIDVEYAGSIQADRSVIFRYNSPNEWYGLHSYNNSIAYEKIIGNFYNLEWLNYTFQPNNVYHYDIDFIDGKITISINGIPVKEFEDTAPYLQNSTIALIAGVGADPDSEVWFDNVVVTELNEDLDVPYFSQNVDPWGHQEYDHSSQYGFANTKFERWGCAVTSAAMVLNYHGINKFLDDTPINPGTLNDWLNNNNGYMTGYNQKGEGYSYINFSKVAALTKQLYEAEKAPIQLTHRRYTENLEDSIIENDLQNKWPVILRVQNNVTDSHFVVAKGVLGNEQGKYSINDPEWNYSSLLPFNNNYFQIDRFISHTFPIYEDTARLSTLGVSDVNFGYITLVVNGDVDMLVANQNGQKTGSIITNGERTVYNDIPDASYSLDPAISNPDQFGNPESLGTDVHVFLLSVPADGEYRITLSGEDSQNYSLNMSLMESNGESLDNRIDGVVYPQFERTISFKYSQTEKSSIENPVTFQSTIADIQKAVELKLMNKALGNNIIALLKSANHDIKHNKRFGNYIAKKKLDVINMLLDKAQGHKFILDSNAKEIISYDLQSLHDNL